MGHRKGHTVSRQQPYAQAMASVAREQLAALSLSLSVAKQDVSRVFVELREKMERASKLAARTDPSKDDLSRMMDILDDCEQMMSVLRGFRILGETAWEQVDLEDVPDGQSVFV